jgi:hypothetical protein
LAKKSFPLDEKTEAMADFSMFRQKVVIGWVEGFDQAHFPISIQSPSLVKPTQLSSLSNSKALDDKALM